MHMEIKEKEEPRITLSLCLGDQVNDSAINWNRKYRKIRGEHNELGFCRAISEAPVRHLFVYMI